MEIHECNIDIDNKDSSCSEKNTILENKTAGKVEIHEYNTNIVNKDSTCGEENIFQKIK